MLLSFQFITSLLLLSTPTYVVRISADEANTVVDDVVVTDTIQRRSLTNRIIGGTPALEKEFPSFIFAGGCGGTLLAHDLVLTAAHCEYSILDKDSIRIGGSSKINTGGKVHKVKTIHVHPGYNVNTNANDIAIVQLKCSSREPTQLLNWKSIKPRNREKLLAVGYGATFEGGALSDVLMKVTVNNVPSATCRRLYQSYYPIYRDQMICAAVTGGGKDTCQGDSGGPIYAYDSINTNATTPTNVTAPKTLVQVGITSWGIGCAQPNFPGVYTRVSKYKAYIEGIIGNYSNPVPKYCA